MKTLYKLDTTGKVRVFNIYTQGADLVQETGVLDGAMVENRKTCKAKNVGKANATTPEEQAISELNSAVNSKLDEGYFLTQEEAEKGEVILPMLAKDYAKEKSKVTWDEGFIVAQPKLDGMRCLAFKKGESVTLVSRKGKVIENMDHIVEALQAISGDCILDGELYAHGSNFQSQMKMIKKFSEASLKIKYNVYDIFSDEAYITRYYQIVEKLKTVNSDVVTQVKSKMIHSEEDLKAIHAKYLQDGYEGTMVRWGDAGYKKNGRSSNLLKYKDFQDIVCEIIDIEPAEQRPEWGIPVLLHEGKLFRAGLKMSHDQRKEFLINKNDYIGKMAEIRFFEYSEEGIPRFPVCVGVRLDKDATDEE